MSAYVFRKTTKERMKKTVLVFDTETTGVPMYLEKQDKYSKRVLNPDLSKQPGIIQFGYILLEYNINENVFTEIESESHLFNPGMPISEGAIEVHGITDEMVENEKPFVSFFEKLSNLLSADYVVGHNIQFDLLMIKFEAERNLNNQIGQHILEVMDKNRGIAEGLISNDEDSFEVKTDKKKNREEWIQENIQQSEYYAGLKMPAKDVFKLIAEFGGYGEKTIDTMHVGTELCQIPSNSDFGSIYKWPNLQELHTKLFRDGFIGGHDAMVDTKITAKCLTEMVYSGYVKI